MTHSSIAQPIIELLFLLVYQRYTSKCSRFLFCSEIKTPSLRKASVELVNLSLPVRACLRTTSCLCATLT